MTTCHLRGLYDFTFFLRMIWYFFLKALQISSIWLIGFFQRSFSAYTLWKWIVHPGFAIHSAAGRNLSVPGKYPMITRSARSFNERAAIMQSPCIAIIFVILFSWVLSVRKL